MKTAQLEFYKSFYSWNPGVVTITFMDKTWSIPIKRDTGYFGTGSHVDLKLNPSGTTSAESKVRCQTMDSIIQSFPKELVNLVEGYLTEAFVKDNHKDEQGLLQEAGLNGGFNEVLRTLIKCEPSSTIFCIALEPVDDDGMHSLQSAADCIQRAHLIDSDNWYRVGGVNQVGGVARKDERTIEVYNYKHGRRVEFSFDSDLPCYAYVHMYTDGGVGKDIDTAFWLAFLIEP